MKNENKKSVLLARVSTKEQAMEGYSLPSQVKLLEDYARNKGLNIAKRFKISESASGKKIRENFNEMMAYVKAKNIKIILVEKVDRLTRNFKDAVDANDWLEGDESREIHFVKQGLTMRKNSKSNEKLQWDIHIVMARNYINNLSEEVKKGQLEKIRQGWYPTKPPLGYKTIGEKGHKMHIQDKDLAPFIKKIFEFYASGNYTTRRLVDVMYDEGLRARTGNKVPRASMHRMLREPFYMGKMTWAGEEYQGKHEPIVSEDLWNKAQDILTRENSGGKYRKHFYYLRGLIKCADCGYSVTAARQKGNVYYNCTHYKPCNNRKYVREEILEEQLLDGLDKTKIENPRLLEWLQRALKESHADEIEYHNKCLNTLNKRYEQIQRRLDMLYDDKLDEKITPEFYEKKFKQYSEEQDAVLRQLKQHKNSNIAYFELGSALIDVAHNSTEIFKQAQPEQKKELINLAFSNLALNGDKLGYTYTKPFQILAKHAYRVNHIFEPAKNRIKPSKNGLCEAEIAPML